MKMSVIFHVFLLTAFFDISLRFFLAILFQVVRHTSFRDVVAY